MKCADGPANAGGESKEAAAINGRAGRREVAVQAAEVVMMVVMRHVDRLTTGTLRLDEDRMNRPQAE